MTPLFAFSLVLFAAETQEENTNEMVVLDPEEEKEAEPKIELIPDSPQNEEVEPSDVPEDSENLETPEPSEETRDDHKTSTSQREWEKPGETESPQEGSEDLRFTGRDFWGNVVGTEGEVFIGNARADLRPRAETIQSIGHSGPVEALCFTSDYRKLISGGSDRQIILWNIENGNEIKRFPAQRGAITGLSASRSGDNFVSCSDDRRCFLWNDRSDTSLLEYPRLIDNPQCIAMNSAASRAYVGLQDGNITLFRGEVIAVAEGTQNVKGHLLAINTISLSPNESLLLTGSSDRTLSVWNARTFEKITTFRKHVGHVLCAAFSPDGKKVVSAGKDKFAIVWDPATGVEHFRISGHYNDITHVSFTNDGKHILTASKDRTIIFWDAETGEKISSAPKRNSPIHTAALNLVNKSVAIGCSNGTIEILAESVFVAEKTLESDAGGEESLSSDSNRNLDAEEMMKLPKAVQNFRFGRTSNYSDFGAVNASGLAFASINSNKGEGTLWNAENGRNIHLLRTAHSMRSVCFHPTNPDYLLTGTWNGLILFWDLAQQRIIEERRAQNSAVVSLAFSGDGSRFLSAGNDGTVILWDSETKEKLHEFKGAEFGIVSIAFSRSGRYCAIGSSSKEIGLWDLESRSETVLSKHNLGTNYVAFTPDDRFLISAGSEGKAVLWEISTGEAIREFDVQGDSIISIAISPDGSLLLTGLRKREMSILWDIPTGKPLMILPYQGGGVSATMFHPAYFSVITVGGRTPSLWDISSVRK